MLCHGIKELFWRLLWRLVIKLKRSVKKNGLTQQQFAEKLYISFQSVSNWERHKGHPTTEMMLLIIEKFDLPLDFFYYSAD